LERIANSEAWQRVPTGQNQFARFTVPLAQRSANALSLRRVSSRKAEKQWQAARISDSLGFGRWLVQSSQTHH